jgi:hypothetical protein
MKQVGNLVILPFLILVISFCEPERILSKEVH